MRSAREVASNLDVWATSALKEPGARLLLRIPRTSADALNLAGLAGCLAAAVLEVFGVEVAAVTVFAISSGLDVFDGTVARLTTGVTRLGGWQDAFFGSVGELAFIAAVTTNHLDQSRSFLITALLVLVTTSLTSQAKSLAGEYGIERVWNDVRVLGRGVRIALIVVGLYLSHAAMKLDDLIRIYTFVALLLFNVCTLIQRIRRVYAH